MHTCGAFFCKKMRYDKQPNTIQDQITLLKERNLKIPTDERAEKYLKTVGYYRLTGYMYHLQERDGTHKFKPDISFDDIIDTYNFDKKLRMLTLNYLERIEVAMRALITQNYSLSKGFLWYTDSNNFVKPVKPPENIEEDVNNGKMELPRKYINMHHYICKTIKERFDESKDTFALKFKDKYTNESYPPCNMALEVVSMGCISKMYDSLANCTEKQDIAKSFEISYNVLQSWLVFLTNIRNICAHHGRLWNRKTTADKFIIPNREFQKFKGSVPDNFVYTYYGTLSIMIKLLSKINSTNSLEKKFRDLIKEYPKINTRHMGFPDDWMENPAWK